MAGHDRFVADLRPLFERRRAGGAALCCHPYDLCTELIARELGVLVTDEQGSTLGCATRRDIRCGLDRLCERRSQGAHRATSSARADAARTDRLTRPLRPVVSRAAGRSRPRTIRGRCGGSAERSAHGRRSAGHGSGDSVFVARAPGRLDVMGGIADYSGALVLQWPIREATRVALLPVARTRISRSHRLGAAASSVIVTSRWIWSPIAHRPYDDVRAWFAATLRATGPPTSRGVFHVLSREHGVHFRNGAAILIESDVPEGKGVSSSAAIEAATMEAVVAAWQRVASSRGCARSAVSRSRT